MRIDRSFIGWGIFFVIVGAIPLAVRAGYLTSAQVTGLWRFWPLVLVIAGVGILLRRTPLHWLGGLLMAALFGVMVGGALNSGIGGFGGFPGGVCGGSTAGTPFPARDGSLDPVTGEVDIELDCGDLVVSTRPGSSWHLEGQDRIGSGPEIGADEGSLRIRSRDGERGPFDRLSDRETWRLTLPADPRLDLSLDVNAGNATFDLGNARLRVVSLQLNAGSATLDMGAAASLEQLDLEANAGSLGVTLPPVSLVGDIQVNAGSVNLCVPDDVALRIQASDNPIASYDFGGHGLIQDGSLWQTPGFDIATVRIDLAVEANAGSIKLDPTEGCSG